MITGFFKQSDDCNTNVIPVHVVPEVSYKKDHLVPDVSKQKGEPVQQKKASNIRPQLEENVETGDKLILITLKKNM